MSEDKSNTENRKDNVEELSSRDLAGTLRTRMVDNQTPTNSTYESLFCLFSYLKRFIIRLCKDAVVTLLFYFYSNNVLPDHILDLIRVHQRLLIERETHTAVYSRNVDQLTITHVASSRQWSTFYSEAGLKLDKELSKLLCNQDLDLEEIVKLLYKDDDFLLAAETGHVKTLEKLLSRGVDIHKLDYMGRNALHLAVCSGNAEAIALLLTAKVDPNVKDNIGMTPLSLCLIRNPSLKLVKLLFAHGAVILPRTALYSGLFLEYVMMCNGTKEDAKILNLLLEKGALINDPDAPGQRQALHFAAMSNNCDLIRILVQLGADLYATNHRGETPKQVAITYKCREAQTLLEELEALEKKLRENAAALAKRSINLTSMIKTHPSVNWTS